jgi:hypothetical protein
MEPQLAKDLVSFLANGEDVGCIAVKSTGDELDVADELLVSNELRAERATESEVGMEYLWHQGEVGVMGFPRFDGHFW